MSRGVLSNSSDLSTKATEYFFMYGRVITYRGLCHGWKNCPEFLTGKKKNMTQLTHEKEETKQSSSSETG